MADLAEQEIPPVKVSTTSPRADVVTFFRGGVAGAPVDCREEGAIERRLGSRVTATFLAPDQFNGRPRNAWGRDAALRSAPDRCPSQLTGLGKTLIGEEPFNKGQEAALRSVSGNTTWIDLDQDPLTPRVEPETVALKIITDQNDLR